jgi:hypothetical protein
LHADVLKRFLHLIELEGLYDGFDFLHGGPGAARPRLVGGSSG